tara:strand:+ start:105594 stop:106487 length:894 start_codon:yes stop_codon:yes gene_type:complete
MENKTKLFLTRPFEFKLNPETAIDNKLQQTLELTQKEINQRVHHEFDQLINLIEGKIDYYIFQDTALPSTPDSIFPNNWFSTENKMLTLYPMKANNRQLERTKGGLELIQKHMNYPINDLTHYEAENKFLEGTGVLVFDHQNKIAYCALSERANLELAKKHTLDINYQLIAFETKDRDGNAIYHTNVMLAVLKNHIVYCEEVIANQADKDLIEKSILNSAKRPLKVSYDQMLGFTCNILAVNDYLLMSTQAYESFHMEQRENLSKDYEILHTDLKTIETLGGGGCRCMLAELFPINF